MIQVTVYGSPAPAGSKRFVGHAKSGRGILIESSKAAKPWRQAVLYAAITAGGRVAGPVDVEMVFTMPRPKSAPKRRKTWPDKKPDIDKLCRCTFDSLVDAGLIEDDARCVKLTASKVFPGDHVLALPVPGASIRIFSALDRGTVAVNV